jgi:hypothetical protein
MKKILLLCAFCIPGAVSFAQQTFDLATFTPPAGWVNQPGESAVQFTKEDTDKGTYCLITLFKAVPATADPKENFDMAWTAMVKEQVTVSAAPEMQPAEKAHGWDIVSGYAPFEKEGTTGVVVLVTASGFGKMVNAIILTNTDVYEKEISSFLESISLTKPATGMINNTTAAVAPDQGTTPAANGFAFTTSNFDNGWTSTVQEDWVQVTKGNIKVLIHYPNKAADTYNSVLMDGLTNAWNVLVAPRYTNAGHVEFKPVSSWQSLEFAEADAVEKATGQTVHVVLFKMNYSTGNGKFMEFITPDKSVFEQEFGVYHQSTSGWEKMEDMAGYNKFAVAASDLRGKWTSNFTGMRQYVNAYTGASAGADTYASNEAFEFGAGSTYKWSVGVASGFVGNIKFQSAKSNGRFSVPNNWQISFTDIEGKPRIYNAFFSCIKGFRILWIDDKAYGKVE